MSYSYVIQRSEVFTESGSIMFTRIRDKVRELLAVAGAFEMGKAITGSGDSWTMLACVDRMVELGEIREISQPGCAGQHRVFVAYMRT